MERHGGLERGSIYADDKQAESFAFGDSNPSAQSDPFADLVDLSFMGRPKPVTPAPTAPSTTIGPAPARKGDSSQQLSYRARKPVASPGVEGAAVNVDPLSAVEGPLAAQRRRSQESRQKRDQFLNQMSSFLEGIENNTGASSSTGDLIPPEPPASFSSGVSGSWYEEAAAPSQPPLAQAESAGTGRVSRTEAGWARKPEEAMMAPAAAKKIFPGPTKGAGYAPREGATGPPSSSLMEEYQDVLVDPFATRPLPSFHQGKSSGTMRGVIVEDDRPHPRGSLFEDDIDPNPIEPEDVEGHEEVESSNRQPEANVHARNSTASSAPLSTPQYDKFKGRSLSQPRSRGKAKPARGLDLEEVRRRTSLLSGGGGHPSPPSAAQAVTPARPIAPQPPDTPSYFDGDWQRQKTLSKPSLPSGEAPPHPLHAASASDNPLLSSAVSGGTFDERGNYFNEELLRARGQNVSSSSSIPQEIGVAGQGARRGDALMDSAGNFISSARDGAKTLLRDAKAGVGAVGSNWQKGRRENGRNGQGLERSGSSRLTRKKGEFDPEEFEATFGEGRLGFTLYREQDGPQKGKGVVCRVHPGSTADALGIRIADIVSGVNKRRYDTYDEVMGVLPKLPRPVLITFTRALKEDRPASTFAPAARPSSMADQQQQQQGGGNPLEWLAKLNPFDKQRRETQEELGSERRNSADASQDGQTGFLGEVFAQGIRGGVFSWSYYGTSDGVEVNSKDTYTEHVMRCQWGRTVDTMQSWMVARRYREFDALVWDLRQAYPDRKDALPRLPPKEFFKMAPDVVERRAKGLKVFMTTIIRRFPDMLESSQLDRFLTISERISSMRNQASSKKSQELMYRNLGTHGSSSNVFAVSEPAMDSSAGVGSSAIVGTDYILDLMTSEGAYNLSRERKTDPVDVQVAENIIRELEEHLSRLSPTAHLLSDAKLYSLVERCQECWPRIKAAAAAALSGGMPETLFPRVLQCDEAMERAFERLKAGLASRGYI